MRDGQPETLREAMIHFASEDNAHAFMVAIRWPEGPQCPFCGTFNVTLLSTRRVFKCKVKGCRKQFTAKRGTIFEDSPLSLGLWFAAAWLISNCKNGISSYEIARDLDVCQKTAWFVLHRLRRAMKAGSFDKKLCGIIEADECHIGGLFKNMHKGKRERIKGGKKANSSTGKTIVQAVLERDGEVRAQVLENLTLAPRLDFLQEHAEAGAQLMTDEGYDSPQVDAAFAHEFVNHQIEYVRGNVHCNGVENFWSLLQRGLSGTYISVEPYHLSAYVDEQAFRFNNRKTDDGDRFVRTLSQVSGRRLTYKELTRNESVN
ncbi:MAG TPA: IS1595 family transposase [Thermoanaerobaculia bacterium]|jgi:transposase-like protein|nr:IS1595 family transposase [Thermoanaerobaculia bacterium]